MRKPKRLFLRSIKKRIFENFGQFGRNEGINTGKLLVVKLVGLPKNFYILSSDKLCNYYKNEENISENVVRTTVF